jgi:hypothetical protein
VLSSSPRPLAKWAKWAVVFRRRKVLANLRSDAEFERLYAAVTGRCTQLGINIEKGQSKKRARNVPTHLQNCVLDRFLTTSSDACAGGDKVKQVLQLDMFFPVLDTVTVSLDSRFNPECVTVIESISVVLRLEVDDNFDLAVKNLCVIAKLDADLCIADSKQMIASRPFGCEYKSLVTLHSLSQKMIECKHSIVYKNFYSLVVFLQTLPVTSASCERAHSKVDLIKSAIRARMGSERLEDLVIVSSEKQILDNLDLFAVVDRFALQERALPL